jgi:hypothetical protein
VSVVSVFFLSVAYLFLNFVLCERITTRVDSNKKKGDPDALSERKLGYLLVELAADLDHPKSNWILFVALDMVG